jgi:hypothetical protein
MQPASVFLVTPGATFGAQAAVITEFFHPGLGALAGALIEFAAVHLNSRRLKCARFTPYCD